MGNGASLTSNALINENKVRLNALWVFVLVMFSIFNLGLLIMAFLAVDFFLRGFNLGKYSPLAKLSDFVIKQFSIGNKPIYMAPKRFAARIGFILAMLTVAALLLQLGVLALGLGIVFAFFAFLESFLGICAGCYVYSFFVQLKLIKQ